MEIIKSEMSESIHIQLNLDDKIYNKLLQDVSEVMKQVDNVCVICFGNQNLHNLFTSKCNDTFLDAILQMYTDLEVFSKAPPHKICSGCVKDLVQVYAFHKRCSKAKELLAEIKVYKDNKCGVETRAKGLIKHTNKILIIKDDISENEEKTVKKGYTCNHCNVNIPKFNEFRAHMRESHANENKVICDICGKLCDNRKKLTEHKVLHKDKLLSCETCGRQFKTAAHLNTHNKFVHLGEKREKNELCTLCGRSFTQKCNLNKHMVSHTKERKYKCDICTRAFPTHSNLKRHKMSHTGERPHVCQYCDKGFIQKVTLRDHLEKTHQIFKNKQDETILVFK